jgi:dihydroneopterin aldolase
MKSSAVWSVRIERLRIELAVGVYPRERPPQPLWVDLTLEGIAPDSPRSLSECIDYEPLLKWLKEEWPQTPHTPLLETRVNQLLAFAFAMDARIHTVKVGLYKELVSRGAIAVGIEREATRPQFAAQLKAAPSELSEHFY